MYKFSTWKLQAQNISPQSRLCTSIVLNVKMKKKQNNLCTQHVLKIFWACNIHVLNLQFNEQSVVTLRVSWCKKKSFWQRFTCNGSKFVIIITVRFGEIPATIWQVFFSKFCNNAKNSWFSVGSYDHDVPFLFDRRFWGSQSQYFASQLWFQHWECCQ